MKPAGFHRSAAAVAAFLGILLLSECPLTPETEEETGVPGEDLEQRSDLFVQPENAPGKFVFFTNDPDLWGPYGCTLWTLTGKRQEPFEARELELQKVSGDLSAGFGAILCHREDPDFGETMLVVLINSRRQYTVGEVSGTQFQYLVSWTQCLALADGYALNRLRLQGDGEGFDLFFNGVKACRFLDAEEPLHAGGSDGLIVVISPLDRFQQGAVHVVFQEQDP
jgi:hypothetical protein